MKKIYFLIAIWLITLLFAGCGAAGTSPSEAMAAKCLVAVFEAETTEEINDHLTDDSQSMAALCVLGYPGDDYKVTVHYCGSYEDYDIFYYEARMGRNEAILNSDYAMLRRSATGYRLCLNPTVIMKMTANCLCSDCGGMGMHLNTGDVCKTCDGQGMHFH